MRPRQAVSIRHMSTGSAMDSHKVAPATQLAKELCNCVARRAAEVGFYDGMITAVRHQGKVSRVRFELFDAQGTSTGHVPLATPTRSVGLGEAQQIFRDTMQEGLEYCVVRFGNVTTWFSRGVLRQVSVTENFRIEEEINELGRLFLPPFGHPLNGHGTRRTPGGGNGRHA